MRHWHITPIDRQADRGAGRCRLPSPSLLYFVPRIGCRLGTGGAWVGCRSFHVNWRVRAAVAPVCCPLCPFPRVFFYARIPNISSIYGFPLWFVSVLCISSDEAIVRLSFVLYYLTVEKVETFLGASPGGVNIYGAVSFCCSLVSHSLRSFIVGLLFFFSCCFSFICSSPVASRPSVSS